MITIVGAGVMGASVAYHLTARGCRDVVLLDRGAGPGGGSTSRATGGFRAQYASAINIRLSLLARDKLQRFSDEVGPDPGYVPAGYLWVASNERDLAELRAALQLQHAEWLTEAAELTPEDIRRLNPALAGDGIIGGTYCPTDGFLRPMALLDGYLNAAVRAGARVEFGVDVRRLERGADGRVTRMVTSAGTREAGVVVNAAGAWAGALAAGAGLDVPVTPLRRQVAVTAPTDALPEGMPMTIFVEDGFHLRVRDGRVLLLWPTPGIEGRPFDTAVDPGWLAAIAGKAHERVPPLRGVRVDREGSWAGLYEMSPDKHAILGPAPGCPNLYLINGSSGHGVMHAPALGQLLAEMLLEGKATALDTSPLRPERFAQGAPNPTSELL